MRLSLFTAFFVALVWTGADARTLTMSDLRTIVNVSDPQLSPDGTRLVYTRSVSDYVKDRSISSLVLIDLRSSRSRELTYERHGIGTARWSPNGDRIAFIAPHKTGKGDQEQLYIMRLDGGDPRAITKFPAGIETLAWSPDGTRVAIVAHEKNPSEKAVEKHLDAFEVFNNDYLHESPATKSFLYVVNAETGRSREYRLSSGTLSLVGPDQTPAPSWSADGRRIAAVVFTTPFIGDSLDGSVKIVNLLSGTWGSATGERLQGDAAFAPMGNLLAYTRSTHGDPTNGQGLYVTGSASPGYDVRASLDRNVSSYRWNAHGDGFWVNGGDATHSALWYQPLHGDARRVSLNGMAFASFGNVAKDGTLAFIANTSNHPGEVFVLHRNGLLAQRITNDNARFDALQLGRVTSLSWKSTKGFSPDGVLTYPPGWQRGRKYPLVLLIHGGPQSASTEGWSSRRQLFASHGYFVFEPNYRGSTNLGDRYQHAIAFDAGQGPGQDVMSGLTAVENMGVVDRSRIGVSGWSYGGYMTSWLIGHYHPWKVAVSGAALNDWFDDYNVSFYVHTDEPYFGGSPWNPKYTKMWIEQSPITYAPQVKTPTLIMGDLGDNNVTITNSFKMYHALRDNNVPVQFVAYPVAGHFPSDPVRSEDVSRRWIAWLDRYLK